MKKSTCLSVVLLMAFVAQAQTAKRSETATFEDGTVLKYYIMQDQPSEVFHHYLTVMPGLNELGNSTELSFSGIIPGKIQYSAAVNLKFKGGLAGALFGTSVYLKKWQFETVQPLAIKQANVNGMTTRYVVRIPIIKERYIGLHAEGGFDHIVYDNANYVYEADSDNRFTLTDVKYGITALGLVYTSFKGVQIKNGEVDAPFVGYTSLFNAVAEVVYYPGFKMEAEPLMSWNNGTKPLLPEHVSNGNVGVKIYVQAKTTFGYYKYRVPIGCIGFTWKVGMVKAPHINDYSMLAGPRSKSTLLFGAGLFVVFK